MLHGWFSTNVLFCEKTLLIAFDIVSVSCLNGFLCKFLTIPLYLRCHSSHCASRLNLLAVSTKLLFLLQPRENALLSVTNGNDQISFNCCHKSFQKFITRVRRKLFINIQFLKKISPISSITLFILYSA